MHSNETPVLSQEKAMQAMTTTRPISKKLVLPVAVFFAIVIVATNLGAQEHQFYERGAVRESLTSIDAVNKANGNGIIDLPLGPVYSIGGNLDFQLRLFYNSKVWDTWQGRPDQIMGRSDPNSFPSRKSNAGVGWTLELGQLIPPRAETVSPLNRTTHWMYVAPDGSSHLFYNRLHESDLDICEGDENSGVFYTRDGSYLRLKTGTPNIVEFPDGSVHEFARKDDTLGGTYRVTKIYDAFGPNENFLSFSYSDGFREVNITDSHFRTWSLHFDKWVSPDHDAWKQEWKKTLYLLKKIEMPGVGDQTVDYLLKHEFQDHVPGCAGDVVSRVNPPFLTAIFLPKPDGQPRPKFSISYYQSIDPNGTVLNSDINACRHGALESLTLPTGGSIHWKHDAFDAKGHCQELDSVYLWNRTSKVVEREYRDVGGRTLARWSYRYSLSDPPKNPPEKAIIEELDCSDDTTRDLASEVVGVREITPLDDRVYTFHAIWPISASSERGFDRYNFGDPVVIGNSQAAEPTEFPGLPFLEGQMTLSSGLLPQIGSGNRLLSTVTFDCASRTDTSTCALFSAEYLRMETEEPFDAACGSTNTDVFETYSSTADRNQRVVSRLENFCFQENDGNGGSVTHCNPKTTNFSDFDGLGHYRVQNQFGWSGHSRRVMTNYNPGVGTFEVDANHNPSGSFSLPSPSTPWVLMTYDHVETSGPEGRSRVEVHFDRSNGQLKRERIVAAGGGDIGSTQDSQPEDWQGRSPKDVLVAYEHDFGGNLIEEKRFGGDLQNNLPTSELSSIDPASLVPEYHKKYTVSQGIRTSEAWLRGGVEFLKNFESTVDFNTGLVRSTRDPAGVETTLDYDVLNRLTKIDKEGLAAREATYTSPHSGCNCSKITIAQADRIEEVWKDGFGRNIRQRELFPNGKYSIQRFEYGSQGLPTRLSTVHYDAAFAGWTRLENYDPRGRARRTVYPDGSVETNNVQGEALFVTRRKVRTSATGEENVPHRIFKDYLGRIVKVEEHSGAGGARVATSYAYDIGDRLVQVSTPMPDQSPQLRTFTYDNRGFLSKEFHPEKAGNPVTHCRYDSLGNSGITVDGAQGACAGLALPSGASSLRFVYDAAARPTQVWDLASNRLMVENFYARTNRDSGSSKSRGKIYQTRRHNYPPSLGGEDLVVTETYDYSHAGGLMTEIRTRANRSLVGLDSGLSFVQMFEWDSLGNLNRYLTPVEQVDIYGLPLEQRVTELDYQRGFVASMTSEWRTFDDLNKSAAVESRVNSVDSGALDGLFDKAALEEVSLRTDKVIDSVTYHAHGGPKVVNWGNGVSETVTLPPSRMARPGRIFTSGASADWDSGTYSYGGSGNVTTIGNDSFIYDEVSRLAEATVSGNNRSYEYDRFGNLERLGDTSFSVVSEHNRLNGVAYDRRGNMTSVSGAAYQYDPLNMVVSADLPELGSPAEYAYGPNDERIAIARPEESSEVTWTLRDNSNLLGRDYTQQGKNLLAKVDYLHGVRGFANFDYEENDFHFGHTDHLGSTRLVTDGVGRKVAVYDYMPFGEEILHPDTSPSTEQRLRFTGHERDSSDQDYMHARFYRNDAGRFMTVDPILGTIMEPQTWNRFAYARNNPLRFIDPTGLDETCTSPETSSSGTCEGEATDDLTDREIQEVLDEVSSKLLVDPPKTEIDLRLLNATVEITPITSISPRGVTVLEGRVDIFAEDGTLISSEVQVIASNQLDSTGTLGLLQNAELLFGAMQRPDRSDPTAPNPIETNESPTESARGAFPRANRITREDMRNLINQLRRLEAKKTQRQPARRQRRK